MRTKVFGFISMLGMNLRKRITDFTFNLRTVFTVIEIEIFGGSGTGSANRFFRNFVMRVSGFNRFYCLPSFFLKAAISSL